ncbi:MAG: arsenate reductase (glutaredoxin) [Hyphomicrobiales bacterium]
MTITIYHNPKCGTSRNTLAMIEQSGAMLDVIDYQKTPIGRAKLVEVIAATGLSVRDILRQRGTPYDELDLGNEKWSNDELIDFIVEHPILMNRPIVVSPKGAVLARPSEKVLDILPNPDIGSFTKEDGDVVK